MRRSTLAVIGELVRGVPEVELREIPGQMLEADVVMRAVERALVGRSSSRLCWSRCCQDVLAGRVVDATCTGHVGADRLVGRWDSVQTSRPSSPRSLRSCERRVRPLTSRDDLGASLARVRVDQGDNRNLVGAPYRLRLTPFHGAILGLTTDLSFIGHDDSVEQIWARSVDHRLSDSVGA